MTKLYFAILGLITINLSAQVQKDTINIDEVIIQENRFSTPISKKNRNVYVIDKVAIEKLPGRSIQEILQYANGVDLRQRGPFGSQADVSIDGGSFEQTVVLLNGTKIIDAQTAHNMLNLPIPVEVIERIEIIRGPAALTYGVNSLTGAINIITKKPTKSGFLVNTYAGSNFEKDTQDTGNTFYGTGIQVGGVISKEKHQHSLFASHDKSNGYRYNTDFENNKLFYQGNYQVNDNNEILSSFGYINNGFGANGFYAAPGDKNSSEVIQTTFAAIQSKHRLSDKWSLMPRISYRYNYDDYRYYGITNLNAGRSQHYTNALAAELNNSYKMESGELGFGAEFRNEDISSSNIGEHKRDNFGVYLQYRTTFIEKLDVNVGAYANYNSDYKWQVYPGLDVSYAITDAFKVIGNIGTSQRIPSFTDLYLNQRPGNIGNPTLDTENAFQSEIGVKYLKRDFTFNANYFYRKITNFIDWTRTVTTNPWQSNNYGNLNTNGVNMRANYRVSISEDSKFNVNLAYSYLEFKFEDVIPNVFSKYLISSLEHQVTNTVDFQHKNFTVLFATRFNQRVTGPSYWINDFRVSQSIKKVTLYLDAQNIFNTTYYEIGAVPLPSRWFSLGVKLVNF
ncbi:TonB-dependent receptor plug domain-containing protein [Flavobacterium hercynium]|uniref:TonB-dependent receptor n=1 Tax=Flavobacterium hercynium TaxID=387094 RepID=A0A226H9L1_9FLAO|nr:TonB-dependent receptor [Flavobacterium hercynium]OXA90366.1 TonB-dependent receptor [Flavobacterium hercynium]SMP25843.1 iron complex outermembrane recepter protein [Flavobacterium hercynium]